MNGNGLGHSNTIQKEGNCMGSHVLKANWLLWGTNHHVGVFTEMFQWVGTPGPQPFSYSLPKGQLKLHSRGWRCSRLQTIEILLICSLSKHSLLLTGEKFQLDRAPIECVQCYYSNSFKENSVLEIIIMIVAMCVHVDCVALSEVASVFPQCHQVFGARAFTS